MTFDYLQLLKLLAPQAILLVGVLVILFLDQALAIQPPPENRNLLGRILGIVTCLAASAWIYFQSVSGTFYNGMLALDSLSQWVQQGVLWLAIFTILIARADIFTRHIGEFFALILLATVGLTLMVATEELLVAFVSLELTSLTLYILTAFNKRSRNSAEAALKYFLVGSSAAAFTLFGLSLLYGLAGSTNFTTIALTLHHVETAPALLLALVLVAVGFGFKVAAVPFHTWAPDAYQGAPAPAAALVASGSKLAGFFLFTKMFFVSLPAHGGSAGWGSAASGWMLMLAAMAAASLLLGNLAAIVQSNIRRLLAYSAIGHAGYALLAVISGTSLGLSALLYYLFTYGLALIGLFAIIQMLEQENGEMTLRDFAGLHARSPWLAGCLAVFVLSLAGIPPLAGFFGKFYVFVAALKSGGTLGLLWLVAVGIAMSAVALYYYLLILKQAWVVEADSTPLPKPIGPTWPVALLAGAVILFGVAPGLLLNPLEKALAEPTPATSEPSITAFQPVTPLEEPHLPSAHTSNRLR